MRLPCRATQSTSVVPLHSRAGQESSRRLRLGDGPCSCRTRTQAVPSNSRYPARTSTLGEALRRSAQRHSKPYRPDRCHHWQRKLLEPKCGLDSRGTRGVFGSDVYVGGNFADDRRAGDFRSRLAQIDTTTGNASSWNPNAGWKPTHSRYPARTFGGDFNRVNGATARSRLAAFTTSSDTATGWDANNIVYSLAVSGNDVYIGGLTSQRRVGSLETTPPRSMPQPGAWTVAWMELEVRHCTFAQKLVMSQRIVQVVYYLVPNRSQTRPSRNPIRYNAANVVKLLEPLSCRWYVQRAWFR